MSRRRFSTQSPPEERTGVRRDFPRAPPWRILSTMPRKTVYLTQEEVRALALSLPEAQLSSHMGRPDLRVRNKIFATLPQDGRTVNMNTTPQGLDMLLRDGSDAFK